MFGQFLMPVDMEDFIQDTHADEIREYGRKAYLVEDKQIALDCMAQHVENMFHYAKGLEFALQVIGKQEKIKKD